MHAIGIDIGGTKVAIAIVGQEGNVVVSDKLTTDLSISPEEMINRMIASVNKLLDEANLTIDKISGIGIGAPGPLNSKEGLITRPPNLTNWVDVPIVEQIKKTFDLPIRLENDATAAGLAEKWLGAGKDCEDFVYITISTGIGAGIYANGQLLTGSRGNAGDFGHTVIDPSYGRCPCGQVGCLEQVASGTAIALKGSELTGESLSTADVFTRYENNDPIIKPYMDEILNRLGGAFVNLINTFDPEVIAIGGGVSKVGDLLFNPIRDYVKEFALNPDARDTPIVPAQLDQDAGVVGAAGLILQK